MIKQNHSKYLRKAVLFFLATAIALWSWNTISELLGLQHAQYKHIIAACCLLMTARWIVLPRGNHFKKSTA